MSVAQPNSYELDPGGDTMLLVKAPSTMKQMSSDPVNGTARESVDPVELAKKFGDVTLSDEAPIQQFSNSSIETTAECSSSTPDPKFKYVARFRVSSRHLILASPVFSDLFQSELTQNARDQSSKCMEVPLEGDDPDALLILMRLIHGRFKEVPRKVNLATLTQIAILVDKYELLETTELLVEGWILGIKADIPWELTRDLWSYLLIAGVFLNEEVFRKASRVAVLKSYGFLDTYGLPFPGRILDKISSRREELLRMIFSWLDDTRKKLLTEQICRTNLQCNGLALGCLMIGLTRVEMLPLPEHPYECYSVEDVLRDLSEIDVPNQCKNKDSTAYGRHRGNDCQGLKILLESRMAVLQASLEVSILS